jgi:hypothetical protein
MVVESPEKESAYAETGSATSREQQAIMLPSTVQARGNADPDILWSWLLKTFPPF